MEIVLIIAVLVIAMNSVGVSASLRRLVEHHEKFGPEPPASRDALRSDDILLIRTFGVEQASKVLKVTEHEDGSRVVEVEPLGARLAE